MYPVCCACSWCRCVCIHVCVYLCRCVPERGVQHVTHVPAVIVCMCVCMCRCVPEGCVQRVAHVPDVVVDPARLVDEMLTLAQLLADLVLQQRILGGWLYCILRVSSTIQ